MSNHETDYIRIWQKVGQNMKSDEIIRICKEKYRVARQMDPKFIDHDFKWLMGSEIIFELRSADALRKNKYGEYELFGMEIKIDYEHRDELCLFMEVK